MNKQLENHTTVDSMIELVDIFPTLTDITGLPKVPTCPIESNKTILCSEGFSFAPLLSKFYRRDAQKTWKTGVFSQYSRPDDTPQENTDLPNLNDIKIMGYSLRTASMRYTEWVSFNHTTFQQNWTHVHAGELYLHDSDPYEVENQYKNPKYLDLVKKLSVQLRQGWRHALPVLN